jgi:hypothetical protein
MTPFLLLAALGVERKTAAKASWIDENAVSAQFMALVKRSQEEAALMAKLGSLYVS